MTPVHREDARCSVKLDIDCFLPHPTVAPLRFSACGVPVGEGFAKGGEGNKVWKTFVMFNFSYSILTMV